MIRRPPRSTRTDTLFPYTTLFRSAHAALSGSAELQAVLAQANAAGFGRWLETRQVIDVLQAYPASWSPQALVEALRPLTPRLYSIASSQKAVGEEVHLTVAHLEYATTGRTEENPAELQPLMRI